MTALKIATIAGAGMHGSVWNNFTQHLVSVDSTMIDLPGHGLAQATNQSPLATIEEMAEYTIANLGESPVILIGHSMGALVALLAAFDPRVKAVILMGAAARMPVHPDLLRQAKENAEAAGDMILKWGISPACPDIERVRSKLKAIMQQVHPASLAVDLAACNDFLKGETVAKALNKPALIVAGEHDKMTRASDGESFAKLFSQGRFVLIPATGHMMMAENPAACAQYVQPFLSSIAG